MDLRQYGLSAGQTVKASRSLDYQPFVIADDLVTGAAYSWAFAGDPRVRPSLVFRRDQYPADEWLRITDSNNRLRAMYDCFIAELARRYPGGTLLDCACNNGYFPVAAETMGMRGIGMDMVDYAASFDILNDICGTRARFIHQSYDSVAHSLPVTKTYDVIVASAIVCHLPDPLHFFKAIGKIAQEALLFWGQIIDSDTMIISYNPPHMELSRLSSFPNSFNDNTRVSRGMFMHAMAAMGFKNIVEIPWQSAWLPPRLPYSFAASYESGLDAELRTGSPHVAYLAMRK